MQSARPYAATSMPDLRARAFEAGDADAWRRFVEQHPGASAYHTLPWRDVVSSVFGHAPRYLVAEAGGSLRGILPMFEVRMPLLGAKIVSMPYDIGSGGPLAQDEAAACALASAAVDLARARGAGWLECRTGTASPALESLGFQRSEPVLISDLELDPAKDPWKTVAKDHRQSVARATKRGILVREAESAADFDAYYDVYLRAFRDFGTPPYGPSYFPALHRILKPQGLVRVLLAELEGRCVGGMLIFPLGSTWINKIAAVLPEAIPLRAFAAIYGFALDLAVKEGVRRFSFGTSSRGQAGLIDFKERWGALTRPAAVYQLAVRKQPPSLEKYYNENGLAQRAWRRLPVAATPRLGHLLNRWFC
jgi:hypothetical protein